MEKVSSVLDFADGGAWKKKAKENIKNYFKEELAEEIEKGTVVIVS